jgi:hypothetical protein
MNVSIHHQEKIVLRWSLTGTTSGMTKDVTKNSILSVKRQVSSQSMILFTEFMNDNTKMQVNSQSMIFCKKAGQFSKYDIAYRFMNHRWVIVVVFRMVVGFTFAISVYHH